MIFRRAFPILPLFALFFSFSLFANHKAPDLNQWCKEEQKSDKFHLKDFKGKWILQGNSIGGVDSTSGVSFSVIGALEWNEKGQGEIYHSETAIYTGPIGSSLVAMSAAEDLQITLRLDDPAKGVGTLFIYGAESAQQQFFNGEYTFVAIKRKNKAVEIYAQAKKLVAQDGSPLPLAGLGMYHLKRQYRND